MYAILVNENKKINENNYFKSINGKTHNTINYSESFIFLYKNINCKN